MYGLVCKWFSNLIVTYTLLSLFQALSPEDYKRVMKIVETAILSTDLAMYFKKRSRFMEVVENGEFDWQSDEKKERKYYMVK